MANIRIEDKAINIHNPANTQDKEQYERTIKQIRDALRIEYKKEAEKKILAMRKEYQKRILSARKNTLNNPNIMKGLSGNGLIKTGFRQGGGVKAKYHQLLDNLAMDTRHINDVIPFRRAVLQKRISAEISLRDKQGEIASVIVSGVLIEAESTITGYWIGKKIEDYKTNWITLMEEFSNLMKSKHGVLGVRTGLQPTRAGIVVDGAITFTYGH